MKENLNDLRTFVVVAQTGSFTKASQILGVSTSAISHLIKGLEERLQIKLFHRSTRSISTTEAGEKLYQDLEPLFASIEQRIDEIGDLREQLTGTIRINGADFVFLFAIWDKLEKFAKDYPEITLELSSDQRFVNIVAERFDAGIRLGGTIEKDMIAVRISLDLKMCIVASPNYLAKHGTPKTPEELLNHNCLTFRQPTSQSVLPWTLQHPKTKEKVVVKVKGSIVVSSGMVIRQCAVNDLGLIWTFEVSVQKELADGRLVKVMDNWTTTEAGAYLYYPNRNHYSPAFKKLVEVLKE